MRDYYITLDMPTKIAMLKAIESARNRGQTILVRTSHDSETRFQPGVDYSKIYEDVCYSISIDPNFDSTDPIQAAAAQSIRLKTGLTRQIFW